MAEELHSEANFWPEPSIFFCLLVLQNRDDSQRPDWPSAQNPSQWWKFLRMAALGPHRPEALPRAQKAVAESGLSSLIRGMPNLSNGEGMWSCGGVQRTFVDEIRRLAEGRIVISALLFPTPLQFPEHSKDHNIVQSPAGSLRQTIIGLTRALEVWRRRAKRRRRMRKVIYLQSIEI